MPRRELETPLWTDWEPIIEYGGQAYEQLTGKRNKEQAWGENVQTVRDEWKTKTGINLTAEQEAYFKEKHRYSTIDQIMSGIQGMQTGAGGANSPYSPTQGNPTITPPATPETTTTDPFALFNEKFPEQLANMGTLGKSSEEQKAQYDLVNQVIDEMERRGQEKVGGRVEGMGRYTSGLRGSEEDLLTKEMNDQRLKEANNIIVQSADLARSQIQTAINTTMGLVGVKFADIQANADLDFRKWAADMGYSTELAKLQAMADANKMDLWDYILQGGSLAADLVGVVNPWGTQKKDNTISTVGEDIGDWTKYLK